MDPLKEAFLKIKEDIKILKNEISQLKIQIIQIQTNPTHDPVKGIQQTNNQTQIQTNPTHNLAVRGPYNQNINNSIGNNGVSTNQPINQQTNQPTWQISQNTHISEFRKAKNIIESLDDIKTEIRLKFKRLTPQEMLVFSILYNIEEQENTEITYHILANQVNLSESSIRDYINKLIKKGIPIEKVKQNNKIVLLKISQDLRKIATLATIQNLRDL